jgi:hypothetical protein
VNQLVPITSAAHPTRAAAGREAIRFLEFAVIICVSEGGGST